MKTSIIKQLLNHDIPVDEFKRIISSEITEYKKQLQKKGSSVPILLIEDVKYDFKKSDYLNLCRLFINDLIDAYELSYIADALTLSPSVEFENINLLDFLDELTISEEEYILDKKRVLKYMSDIGNVSD